MANEDYNFQYTPLTGRLPGNSFVEQTEQAINELAGIVNEGSAQVEVLTNLANTANDNAEEALEKSTEALETSGRVYITLPNLDDADDYFDSQLYYFANSHSANLPVEDTGFLEVKTNDTKTAAEQVFIADTTGLIYMRHGDITSTEVGDETVYSVTWETWSSELASQDYVQQEVSKCLPLTGGMLTGALTGTDATFSGTITGNVTGNVTGNLTGTASKATNDANNNNIAQTYLPIVVGAVMAFAGSTTPAGWLLCDGSAVSRTTYANLFAVIGTTYGTGNGSTTFNVPNLTNKFIQGNSTAGTTKNAGLPNITGTARIRKFADGRDMIFNFAGALSKGSDQNDPSQTAFPRDNSNYPLNTLSFDASQSNSIYGNSTTVQPPALTMKYIIKY